MDALRRRWLQRLGCLPMLAASPAGAQAEEAESEVRVKAAFVFRFTGYIEWPGSAFAGADTPFVIGVLGADAMLAELGQLLAKRRIQERPVQLRALRAGEPVAGLHLLFVGRDQSVRLPVPPPQGLLVITELDGGLVRGSAINLLLVERRVRFEIALGSAERAGLRLSSRLLAVAQKIHSGEGD